MPDMPTAHRWPCPQCGSDLRFAPGQAKMVCAHCGHAQPMAEAGPWQKSTSLQEIPLAQGLDLDIGDELAEDIRADTCPNCSALVEFLGARHAANCPYCDTPVVVDSGLRRQIKPQALLPFELTETQARAALTKWLSRLSFAPNSLLAYARKHREMQGIYAPFWTFDAATSTRYTGARGEHYYETRTVQVTANGRRESRQEKVQRTSWYPASGHVSRDFDDIITLSTTSLPQGLSNALTPWDLAQLQPYQPEYLAGFLAEGYTIALSDGWQSAKGIMAQAIERDIRDDIGGDVQRIEAVDTRYSHETFKHVLLPIWTAAYKYGGKSYRFVVNGQTGKVQGERPYSIWKIALALLTLAAIGLGILYLNDPAALGLPRPAWMAP